MNPHKYPIVKKAYAIDTHKISEGYFIDELVCHAENRNKARSILYDRIRGEDWKLFTGEDIDFLNIPVSRSPSHDLVVYNGSEVCINVIPSIEIEDERQATLSKIENDPAITHVYIRKGAYYCPGWCGYTEFREKAGVYAKKEAISEAKRVRDIRLVPIEKEEHNDMLRKAIADLESRIMQ